MASLSRDCMTAAAKAIRGVNIKFCKYRSAVVYGTVPFTLVMPRAMGPIIDIYTGKISARQKSRRKASRRASVVLLIMAVSNNMMVVWK